MDEKGISLSYLVRSEEKNGRLYPMFLGVSCAFFVLRLLSESELNDEKWSEIKNRMLQGRAHLLGLLVWGLQQEESTTNEKCELHQKLQNAEKEIEDLRKRRREDAKANEKVVGIFAAREQGWLSERKKLRQHVGALMNELRVLSKKKDQAISELNENLQEKELLVQSKDKILQEEEQKRRQLEEALKKAENDVEELTDAAKCEAQEHSAEMWKHKTAFIELVSNQRQLEAEMGRTFRQIEATKQELDLVLEQKEQSLLITQKLSREIVKMRKDLEHKENILSAMLRKSKLDTSEKQMLLKEVKLSKTKKKQAELETVRSRAVSESKPERNSLRSMLSKHSNSNLAGRGMHSNAAAQSHVGKSRSVPHDLEYDQPELRKEPEFLSILAHQYLEGESEKLANVKKLEAWVRSEAERYTTAIEHRHHLEINAFAEQLRLKDEKLEIFRWRLMSMELESKRLQSHIEGLDHDLAPLRLDNIKLEALLLDREAELHSLRERCELQFNPSKIQNANLNLSSCNLATDHDTVWSKVMTMKTKSREMEQEMKPMPVEISKDIITEEEVETTNKNRTKDIVLTVQSPEEFEEEKDIALDQEGNNRVVGATINEIGNDERLTMCKNKKSLWKLDLNSLGVSYKIKRLNQQLLILERLTGKKERCDDAGSNDQIQFGMKAFCSMMTMLNKQVSRYQSLQDKTDDLCSRMHENDLNVGHGGASTARTKAETKVLEHFLEETFQLQRYIVATGQKLMEIQSKVASSFAAAEEEIEKPVSFDMKRFSDCMRALFREVQRGLEIRIARIIGDLEGILACDGIIHLREYNFSGF